MSGLSYLDNSIMGNFIIDDEKAGFLDSLPMGVAIINSEYDIQFVNKKIKACFKQDVLNKNCVDVFGNNSLWENAANIAQSGKFPDAISRTVEIDSRKFAVDLSFYDESDKSGMLTIFFYGADYLTGLNGNAAKEETKNNMLRRIGHEINNFLTVLLLRGELLKLAVNNKEKFDKAISLLFKHLERLKRYANNLLFLGRAKTVKRDLFKLESFFAAFIPHQETRYSLGEWEVKLDLKDPAFEINSSKDILAIFFSNLFAVVSGTEAEADTILINSSPGSKDSFIDLIITFKEDAFPMEEIEDIMKTKDLDPKKMSTKNTEFASIKHAAEHLDSNLAFLQSDAKIKVTLTIPVNKE